MLSLFGPKALDRGRILIADDDQDVRFVLKLMCSSSFTDLHIEEACNGLEAVRIFTELHPACIVMDLRMPEMDGIDAALTIRQLAQEGNYVMPAIIFCTGFPPPRVMEGIIGDGLYHKLLRKPIDSQQLVDAIASSMKAVPVNLLFPRRRS